MKTLIFGTTNPGTILQIQGALLPLGIGVLPLPEEARSILVEEDGKVAQENARKKALAYATALGQPVLSMDNALFLGGLKDSEQPGIHVRRIGGSSARPTDEEMLKHYSSLVGRLGGQIAGHWEFAFCYARSDATCTETTIISPRIFVATPSEKLVPGYPLESLQIDPRSERYISELSQAEQDEFWQRAIGIELMTFVRSLGV